MLRSAMIGLEISLTTGSPSMVCYSLSIPARRRSDLPEPNVFSLLGHAFGRHAPGRSSDRRISPEGDSLREPYIVGHNLLLSHATAVKAFRTKYGTDSGKQIGLVVNMNWGGESIILLDRASQLTVQSRMTNNKRVGRNSCLLSSRPDALDIDATEKFLALTVRW